MPQYTYDGIGNRLTSAVNDSNGAQSSAYTPNSVNQYTAITGAIADTPSYDGKADPKGSCLTLYLAYPLR